MELEFLAVTRCVLTLRGATSVVVGQVSLCQPMAAYAKVCYHSNVAITLLWEIEIKSVDTTQLY